MRTPLFLHFSPSEVTFSGSQVGNTFSFPSTEPFGLPSAMSPRRELGRTFGPNGVQGRKLTTKPAHPRRMPHLARNLRSGTMVFSKKVRKLHAKYIDKGEEVVSIMFFGYDKATKNQL